MQQLLHSSQEMAAPMLSTSLHVSGNSAEHCKPPHVRFAQEEAISAAEIAMPNLQSREFVHGGARLLATLLLRETRDGSLLRN